MAAFQGGIKSTSSLKAVSLLAVAFAFLLSALIWSLPGERFLIRRSVSSSRPGSSGHVKERVKKSVKDESICTILTPSADDIATLRLPYRENGTDNQRLYDDIYGKGNVLCLVETDCRGKDVLSVKCKTQSCSSYVVKREHSDLPLYNVSPEALEGIVGLQGDSSVRIKLLCYKGKPHNIPVDNWQSLNIRHRRKRWCKRSEDEMRAAQRIHVINVRFLSRWEIFTRMKGLTRLVTSKAFKEMRILDFPKYQSTAWRDIDNLALLLQGHVFTGESNYTLLSEARKKGFEVRLFDLSEEDYQHSLNIKRVLKDDESSCPITETEAGVFDDIPSCNCSIYQRGDIYPEEKLAHLTNCLSRVNAQDGYKGLLTMTFLENTNWDASLEQTVDVAITNIVKNILSADNGAVILLLSDVGNPSFTHLDNSLFLQAQASNPFLFIFYPPASEGEDKHSTLAENRDKLISLRDIQVTISDFLSSDVEIDSRSKYEKVTNQYDGLSLSRSVINSRHTAVLGVHAPNLPICEIDSVSYPNDTLQVAYAETAVGLINNYINNYIQTKTKIDNGIMKHNNEKCRTVIGKRFLNVRKSYSGGTSYTSMDLEIREVSSNTIKMLTGIIIAVQPSPDANNTVSLKYSTSDIKTVIERKIIPLVCADRLEVNMSLILPAQTPLLFATTRSFGTEPKIKTLHSRCLLLVIHSFKDSSSFYVMNVCDDREYTFTFDGHLVNVVSVMPLPALVVLRPGQMHYMTSFVKTSYFVTKHSFHYKTRYEMKVL